MSRVTWSSITAARILIAASVALAAPALAQEESVLEEIVVTAEHREENLQDTEISVTALSSEAITDLGISNSTDLAHVAPNLVVNTFQGGKTGVGINMRGMAQNEVLVSYDPAVSVYVDGILISKNVGALLDIADMERIEILRGPQGTLYGRNTMGGAVNFVTQKPSDEFGGKVVATVGNHGQRDLKGTLNIPLAGAGSSIGALNARLTAATINRDGLVDNNYTGPSFYVPPLPYDTDLYGVGGNDDPRLGTVNSELETKDRVAALLHLHWQPTGELSVLYTGDVTRIDEIPGTVWAHNVNLATTVGFLLQPFNIGRADRPDTISVDGAHLAETDVDGHALHIDYALTESLSFKSITAMREMTNYSLGDSDGSPLAIIQTIDYNEYDQFTQEFRFVGTGMDDRLDYTAGLFYMDEDGFVDNRVDAASLFGFPFGGPFRNVARFKNENWALFGQATYAINDQWSVTAGLRYTEEDREMSKVYNPSALDKLLLGQPDVIDFGTGQRDFDNLSPMISVSYDWNGDVMTYFKVSTGFQSGGFNVRDTNVDPVTFAATTFLDGFGEESLVGYELGTKAELNDRVRVNAAVWYSDYDDKLLNNFNPQTLGNTVRNVGVVEIVGGELELLAQLNDYFRLGFNYGYQNPVYKEYNSPNPDCVTNPACDPPVLDLSRSTGFPYTPENTGGIDLGYEQVLPFGILRARVDWAYRDGYPFLAPQPERNSQESYNLWNARVTLDDIDGPGDTTVRVALWGKNLGDESYYYNGVNVFETFGFDINYYAEPRTYGLDVELRF